MSSGTLVKELVQQIASDPSLQQEMSEFNQQMAKALEHDPLAQQLCQQLVDIKTQLKYLQMGTMLCFFKSWNNVSSTIKIQVGQRFQERLTSDLEKFSHLAMQEMVTRLNAMEGLMPHEQVVEEGKRMRGEVARAVCMFAREQMKRSQPEDYRDLVQ